MTATPQPTRADESATYSRWVARTWLARIVRVAIWLIPVLLSLLVIAVAARRWPADELGTSELGWWALFGALALAVLVFTDRIARRFLPLSALLRMALVFPDQAPSRFGAALRADSQLIGQEMRLDQKDGKGYPAGLVGEEIHPAGRIVAVADAYDVMTSVRSYKKSMPTAMARQEIGRNAGEQFDPVTVRAFLNVGIGQVNTKWGWPGLLPGSDGSGHLGQA